LYHLLLVGVSWDVTWKCVLLIIMLHSKRSFLRNGHTGVLEHVSHSFLLNPQREVGVVFE